MGKISAKTVIFTSFLVDLSDIILSLIVAIVTGSVIMLSQVLEGMADLASSGLLIMGLRKSIQSPDSSHPFGYGKELYVWTLFSGLLMFGISATLSFYFGWQRFIHPQVIKDIYSAYLVLIITTITNGYALSLSYKRLKNKSHLKNIRRIFLRSSLIETKTTFVLDLMGTLASTLGILSLIFYHLTGDYRMDGVGAMMIGVCLAALALLLLVGIKDLLVGKSASPDVIAKIKEAALAVPEVEDVLDLRTMHIGSEKILVNLDVHLRSDLKTREIERLIDEIKLRIEKEVPSVSHVQVELETPD